MKDQPPNTAGWGVAELVTLKNITTVLPIQEINNVRLPIGQVTLNDTDTATTGMPTWVDSGAVVTLKQHDSWIGADKHTNNTGELTALHHAIERALSRPRGSGLECICADSTYAINMAKGTWIPHHGRNKLVIRRLRNGWNLLQTRRPHEVRMTHVRSHTIIAGNDMADWLADKGAVGKKINLQQALEWAIEWSRKSARRKAMARGMVLGDPQGIG